MNDCPVSLYDRLGDPIDLGGDQAIELREGRRDSRHGRSQDGTARLLPDWSASALVLPVTAPGHAVGRADVADEIARRSGVVIGRSTDPSTEDQGMRSR